MARFTHTEFSAEDTISVQGTHHALDFAAYQKEYARSIQDPEGFWREMAERITWVQKPRRIKNTSFVNKQVSIKWYEDGVLNACYNCVDRHAQNKPEALAITWIADDPCAPCKRYCEKSQNLQMF